MTKICGLISSDSNDQVPGLFKKMYDASWQSFYRNREYIINEYGGLGHFNIGAVNNERQPIEVTGRSSVFCGKIFDKTAHCRSLTRTGIPVHELDNDCRFLMHFLDAESSWGLDKINGIYSLAVWDHVDEKLILIGDRYGFRPIYYYHDAARGMLAFSSDLKGILATGLPDLKVNWRGINTFLHLGHLFGPETLFQNIYRLQPAEVLTFENNKVSLSRYWHLKDLPVQENMKMDEAVDGCVDLFRQAMARRLNSSSVRHMALLSGGQDSRHIAAELKEQDVDFTAYTTTGFKPMVQDKVLAEKAAKAMGIKHEYIPLPRNGFLTEYWPRAHAMMDYQTDLHEWILPLLDALPNEPHINFDGILGDVCLSSVYLNQKDYTLARQGKIDALASKLTEREHWPPVFHPSIARHLDRNLLYESLKNKFQVFHGHPNIINFTYMSGRTVSAISLFAFKLVSEKAESYFPFADNDFFDFAMSIPPELKLDGLMHRRVLDRGYPYLKHVPTTKEINSKDYYHDEINYYGQKRDFLWKSLLEMLRGRPWIFDRSSALPRLVRDLCVAGLKRDGRFFLCNPANMVLAEWFERYFPDGVQ